MADEVGRALLSRTVINERVVLYRTLAGAPVALGDRCAHRHLPLSMGRLDGDCLQCGYHGVAYAADGQCVRIPGSAEIPEQAKAVAAATLALAAPPPNPARLVAEPAHRRATRLARALLLVRVYAAFPVRWPLCGA